MKTGFLTRDALSKGITSGIVDATYTISGYVEVKGYFNIFKLGRDVFYTYAEALAEVEKMRLKKIASLRKQIAKLEGIKFPQSEADAYQKNEIDSNTPPFIHGND